MGERLAIDGGAPVRDAILPYGRHTISERDISAVVDVLRSDRLTTGPMVEVFEAAFAGKVQCGSAVALSNGTAALHAAMHAAEIGPGDEVIIPTLTFVATANSVGFQGGTPVFADVDSRTLLLDPVDVEHRITDRTKAIVGVDLAGQPCDYGILEAMARKHDLVLIADACHALGGSVEGRCVGALADMSTFSFHPVKPITTGEGGMVTTDREDWATRMRRFRNHGIDADHNQRERQATWVYEMDHPGFNYRMTDIQCALGISQLQCLDAWTLRRQDIARMYDQAFTGLDWFETPHVRQGVSHAYHLYVIQLNLDTLRVSRAEVFRALRAEGIGVNVHYIPVHTQPYYRNMVPAQDCPCSLEVYERILTLPLFPTMQDSDVGHVIDAATKVCQALEN